MRKTAMISLHPDLMDAGRRMARERYRTFSGLIEQLILEEIARSKTPKNLFID